VTLAWNPNTEPDLKGYKIYYGMASGDYDVTVDVGKWTSCTIDGLEEGETYYFAATAYDSQDRESDFSEEVPYTIPSDNNPPVANDSTISTMEDTSTSGTLSGSDPDEDPLTFILVSTGNKGKATLTSPSSGAFTYTPNDDAHGTDIITFKVNDGSLDSNTAKVTFTINPVNDPPQAVDDVMTTNEDEGVTISVLANDTDIDGDSLELTTVTQPSHGTVSQGEAEVSYVPDADFHGTDSFTYTVSDNQGGKATGTVHIVVNPVNDIPVAIDGSLTTMEDTETSTTLSATDTDGDSLTYIVVNGPAHGTLSGPGPDVTYSPHADYNGPDSFTFKVNDGKVDSNVAIVSIEVKPVDDTITVDAGSDAIIDEGDTFTGSGFFTDPDGDTWTATVDYGDGAGTQPLALNPDKTFTLNHVYSDNGTYIVTVTVHDGGGSAADSVNVTVNNVAPVVEAGPDKTVDQGTAVSFSGSFTDPGADFHAIEWDFGDGSPHVTGTLTPTHTYAQKGIYTVTLTVIDDDGDSGSDILTVVVDEESACKITFNFVDQYGDLSGTGDERVYVDGKGWKVDEGQVTVEPGERIYYRAYYKEGSGLRGPRLYHVCTADITLDVEYRTLTIDFEDQNGPLAGTGEERVYIDHIGYKSKGENITVPLKSTVLHRAYFREGSGLKGPKRRETIDDSAVSLKVKFHRLTMKFEDQNGELVGTGRERVYIDHVGYKADDDKVTVPLNSTVLHRAYIKEGSGLKGPKRRETIDGSTAHLIVKFQKLTMQFKDQSGDLTGTGNERVYLDHVGYKTDGETVTVPLDSTVLHRAYYKEGSGLKGPKLKQTIEGADNNLIVKFWKVSFEVLHQSTTNPVIGAQAYVDHVGYVDNGGEIVVPSESTIRHKAKVDSTWSAKTSKAIDGSWTECTYEWNGAIFSDPYYN
jgi:VCBS repeat-containing protein